MTHDFIPGGNRGWAEIDQRAREADLRQRVTAPCRAAARPGLLLQLLALAQRWRVRARHRAVPAERVPANDRADTALRRRDAKR
jgi:hypothetical protein